MNFTQPWPNVALVVSGKVVVCVCNRFSFLFVELASVDACVNQHMSTQRRIQRNSLVQTIVGVRCCRFFCAPPSMRPSELYCQLMARICGNGRRFLMQGLPMPFLLLRPQLFYCLFSFKYSLIATFDRIVQIIDLPKEWHLPLHGWINTLS